MGCYSVIHREQLSLIWVAASGDCLSHWFASLTAVAEIHTQNALKTDNSPCVFSNEYIEGKAGRGWGKSEQVGQMAVTVAMSLVCKLQMSSSDEQVQ